MITRIHIKNFRSIKNMDINCEDINTFIGKNDVGKSNIMKALNLFFNNEVEYGIEYNFNRDYYHFSGSKKKRETLIELTFRIPDRYNTGKKKNRDVKWGRSWQRVYNADVRNEWMAHKDGEDFPQRSRIPSWLKKIEFHHVPAIKDKEFFSYLMGELYEVLASSTSSHNIHHSASFSGSIMQFKDSIQQEAENLLTELAEMFKMDSEINMPEDFRKIFEDLEFNLGGIPLDRRGDGVKIRHIPEILYFIGNKANASLGRGEAPQTNIWAFEEPENCVEMGSAFKLQAKFIKYASEGYQIFITTHSPIFYKIEKESEQDIKCLNYGVQKEFIKNGSYTKALPANNDEQIAKLDDEIGFLPLIAPYIKETERKVQELEHELKKLQQAKRHTIFLEGKTDAKIFDHALELFFPSYQDKIGIHPLENENGGANYVADSLVAWQKIQKHRSNEDRVNAFGFFDNDDAGKDAHEEVKNSIKKNNNYINCKFYESKITTDIIIRVKKEFPFKFEYNVYLESLYHDEIWEHVKNIKMNANNNDSEQGSMFNAVNGNKILRIQKLNWDSREKSKAVDYIDSIIGKDEDEAKRLLENFEPLLKDALKFLFPRDSL